MTDSVRAGQADAAAGPPPASGRPAGLLGWLSGLAIAASLLIMIGASAVRQDWMRPVIPMPSAGPPFEASVHVPAGLAVLAIWLAAGLAVVGLVAGLLAARRGARGPVRLIMIGAAIAVLALTLLPPVGSSDANDYAAYGRIALLGHNPYLVTPIYLRLTDPHFGQSIPATWQYMVSLYGPAATIEQYGAAVLGGQSVAHVVLWLKIVNLLGFGVVAFVLDRALAARPSARLRAHLLWTVNPLLIWDLIAAGHVDVLAAGAGLCGLLVLGRQRHAAGRPAAPALWRAAAAGALIGVAADVKIDYALFGLALAWALRRSWRALAVAGGGALVVLGPTYAWLGRPAFDALLARRDQTSADSFWQSANLTNWNYLVIVAVALVAGIAVLLLARLPPGDPQRPAIRPAVAFSLAFLLVWPYQLPWYDAMILCVLALFPATWLDWLVLARLTAATLANMPGSPAGPPVRLRAYQTSLVHGVAPAILLAVAVCVIVIAARGRWSAVRTLSSWHWTSAGCSWRPCAG